MTQQASWKKHIIPVLALFGVAFFFSWSSWFFFLANGSYGHDCGIFAYIGMAMKEGRILYTGAWDNKGPLLYFINFLGILINYEYGIYFLELLSLFVTAVFFYKTALLFCDRWISLLSAVFCMVPLGVTLEAGNLSEEYALSFISIGLYLLAKYLLRDCRLTVLEMMVIGMCISATFLLRPNIPVFLGCMVITVAVVLLKQKRFGNLFRLALFSILGFVLFALPFVIYLVCNNALEECLNAAYTGTLTMFSDLSKLLRIRNTVAMIQEFTSAGGLFLVAVFLVGLPTMAFTKNMKTSPLTPLLWGCFAGLWVNLLANTLSGARNMHYFMTFLPIFLLPTAWLLRGVKEFLLKQTQKPVHSTLAVAALILLLITPSFPVVMKNLMAPWRTNDSANASYNRISTFVEENTAPDDTIQAFGSLMSVYYKSHRLAASRYFYYANGSYNDEAKSIFANQIGKDVLKEQPKLILIDNMAKYEEFQRYLDKPQEWAVMIESEYELVENDMNYTIYKHK